MEQLLTPQEVAEILKIKVKTLLYGSLQEEIPKVRIGGKTRYRQQDIQNYINKNTTRLSCIRK